MANLTTFNYLSNSVRVVEIDGNPWFVAADVCRAIGHYVRPNGVVEVSTALRVLDKDQVHTYQIRTERGLRNVLIISESGLYKLIMRSDKPEARKFQDWVTREVLPAIRKEGGYILGEEKVRSGEMDEELVLRAIEVMQRKAKVRLDVEIRAVSTASTGPEKQGCIHA